MDDENKFRIDRNKINQIVQEYNENPDKGNCSLKRRFVINQYIDKIIQELGNENLLKAIGRETLEHYVEGILKGEKIHHFYEDDETYAMLEGLSNKEIVGDWQHFLTVNSEYIFELPQEQQVEFAKNFSIGNVSAQNCLVELWKNHIETTGVDIKRPEVPGSTNNITITLPEEKIPFYVERLARNFPDKGYLLFQWSNEEKLGHIAIHSVDNNMFNNVKDVAPYLNSESRDTPISTPNSYWDKVTKEASLYNVNIMQYLNIDNIKKYEERCNDEKEVLRKSSGLSMQQVTGIKDRIKNVPRYLCNSISILMDKLKPREPEKKTENLYEK